MVTNFGLNSALVLAQLNLGTNSASLLGIFLAVAGAGLYFLRSIRPELARDQDIFFAAVGLLCGGILLTQGWRLDPILQFSQFLLAGSAAFFAYEAIRLRGVATEQAKRNTRIVDDERKVSKVYRYDDQEAELYDNPELEEEDYVSPRLRGTADSRNGRMMESYEGETRRSSRSRSGSERTSSGERQTKRRSRPSSRPSERSVESLEADLDNNWEEESPRSSRQRPSTRPESRAPETPSRPRRRRPTQERASSPPRRDEETVPSDYVDYQPIDSSEEESDKPGRFDY